MEEPSSIPLTTFREYPVDEMQARAVEMYAEMRRRRTVRHFSERPVPREVIEQCLLTAGTAPSGANLQPWHFAVVTDPLVKHQIRVAAEAEEHEFYTRRAPQDWLTALKPYGTDEHKPYLDIAPCLIAIFVQRYGIQQDGQKIKYYYTHESVGIATGFLIAALHHAGLATLTHTPSPMDFLNPILRRPENEKPFLLLVVGYPAPDAMVPVIHKKSLEEIATFFDA
jgi:nitroreductase